MGGRFTRRNHVSAARRREESKALALIVSAIVLPLILAFILVAADMRSDLSDLIPAEALPDHSASLIGWPDLEIRRGRSASLEQTCWQPGRRVRMLGYMMDGYTPRENRPAQDGVPIGAFVLLPDAGQLLHPAHHDPDQMVEVRLAETAQLKYRSLVWATGKLARTMGGRDTGHALYAMTEADTKPAVQSDITLWFKP